MPQTPNSGKPEFFHSKYQPGHCQQIARWLLIALFLVCVPCVKAQSDPNMSGVDDVLGGQRTILQVDDVFTPQSIQLDNDFFAAESSPCRTTMLQKDPANTSQIRGDARNS
jgi:hypothetical protein